MEQTVEQKLKALYELQNLHTKIDKIRQIRGELPMEVADLEDGLPGWIHVYKNLKLNWMIPKTQL